MTGIESVNYYSDQQNYRPRSQGSTEAGILLATLASGAVMGAVPYFSKPFTKQMQREHFNNEVYRDAFIKSVEQSGLKDKGVEIVNRRFSKSDLLAMGTSMESQIVDKDIKAGMNACYVPSQKIIKLNLEQASISGFHEAGHAYNHLLSKSGKVLQKLRGPGYALAGLMGTVALFSRSKPKGEKRNGFDFVQDNAGKIAFAAMLPTVAEEALASHNGIKMAKKAGLDKAIIKNLRKFYGKALISYVGYAVATGVSVFAASKIMDVFTRPRKLS